MDTGYLKVLQVGKPKSCLPVCDLLSFCCPCCCLRCTLLSLCSPFFDNFLCPHRSHELLSCCSLFLLFSLLESEPLLGIGHFLMLRSLGLLFPCLLFPDLGSCYCMLSLQLLPFGHMLCSCTHVDIVCKVQQLLSMVFQPHPPDCSSQF